MDAHVLDQLTPWTQTPEDTAARPSDAIRLDYVEDIKTEEEKRRAVLDDSFNTLWSTSRYFPVYDRLC